jgi:hypothetical protein
VQSLVATYSVPPSRNCSRESSKYQHASAAGLACSATLKCFPPRSCSKSTMRVTEHVRHLAQSVTLVGYQRTCSCVIFSVRASLQKITPCVSSMKPLQHHRKLDACGGKRGASLDTQMCTSLGPASLGLAVLSAQGGAHLKTTVRQAGLPLGRTVATWKYLPYGRWLLACRALSSMPFHAMVPCLCDGRVLVKTPADVCLFVAVAPAEQVGS